jgi:hypothetical protein
VFPPSGFSLIPLGTNFAGHVTIMGDVLQLDVLARKLSTHHIWRNLQMSSDVCDKQVDAAVI